MIRQQVTGLERSRTAPCSFDPRHPGEMALSTDTVAAFWRKLSRIDNRTRSELADVRFPRAVTGFATDPPFEKRNGGEAIERPRRRLQAAGVTSQAFQADRAR